MIRIIHLSDLHVKRSSGEEENKNARALSAHLTKKYAGDRTATNYVVLSGDLVDNADGNEYRSVRGLVLEPLAEHFTLLCVPGNHDYAKWGNVLLANGPSNFRKYVRDVAFPCLDRDEKEGVAFIALDSADPLDRQWFAEGVIGPDQREALDAMLTECEDDFKVVYLHHHPFFRELFLALNDWRALVDVMAGRADLVLFGHKHRSEAFFGWFGLDVSLASGKVTKSAYNALAYRVIEIEDKKIASIRSEEIQAAT